MGLFDLMGGGGMTPEQQKYIGTMGLLGLAGQLLQGAAPTPIPKAGMAGALGKGLQGFTQNAGEAVKDVRIAQGVKSLNEQSDMMKQISEFIRKGIEEANATTPPANAAGLNMPKLGMPQQPAPLTPQYISPQPLGFPQRGLAQQMVPTLPPLGGFGG